MNSLKIGIILYAFTLIAIHTGSAEINAKSSRKLLDDPDLDDDLEGSGSHPDSKFDDMEGSGSGYGPDDEDDDEDESRSLSNAKQSSTANPISTTLPPEKSTPELKVVEMSTTVEPKKQHETRVFKTVANFENDTMNLIPESTNIVESITAKIEPTTEVHTAQPVPVIPTSVVILDEDRGGNGVFIDRKKEERHISFFSQPGILAAIIGGAVVGLLCAILVVMFIVYRMRKKDEGSYVLEEMKRSTAANMYMKPSQREFYA